MKKKSSYQKLKDENKNLKKKCNKYYEANYWARRAVGSNEIYGGDSMCGNEEFPPIRDIDVLKEIILNLPF